MTCLRGGDRSPSQGRFLLLILPLLFKTKRRGAGLEEDFPDAGADDRRGGHKRGAGTGDGWQQGALAGRRGRRRSHALDGAEVVGFNVCPSWSHTTKTRGGRQSALVIIITFPSCSHYQICTNRIPSPSFCRGHCVPHPPGAFDALRLSPTPARTVEQLDSVLEALSHHWPFGESAERPQIWRRETNLVARTVQPLSSQWYLSNCRTLNLAPYL